MKELTVLITNHDCELTIRALQFYIDAYDLDPEEKIEADKVLTQFHKILLN